MTIAQDKQLNGFGSNKFETFDCQCLVKFIDPWRTFRNTHNTEKTGFFHQLRSSKILNVIIIKLLKAHFIVEFEVCLPCNSFFIYF